MPLILILALLVAACGRTDKEAAAPAARTPNPTPRIALIMKSLANEFFVTMAEGAQAHQAANAGKYALIVNGMELEVGWLPSVLPAARNDRVYTGGRGYIDASTAIDPA